MKKNLPTRKNIRLKEYDYSQEGYYFITICTKNRENILSKINDDTINLTWIGNIVEKNIKQIEHIYSNIMVDEYIIMPNHIHFILEINKQANNNISKVIQKFKGASSRIMGYGIWQKLFFEHVIRDEKEYLKIKEYIINNPKNWKEDKYF